MQSNIKMIESFNDIGTGDVSEAGDLIIQCFESGDLPWSHPMFLQHLRISLDFWLSIYDTQIRGLLYCQTVADLMPDGFDDELKQWATSIANGVTPESVMFPYRCNWPGPDIHQVDRMFWIHREIAKLRYMSALFRVLYAPKVKGEDS